jgi:hypothetical protein
MTTKTNRKRSATTEATIARLSRELAQKNKLKTKNKKKSTPFADVGSIIGSGVGSMFGFPQAKGIGRWLGTGIGSIFGSGDYQVVGQNPTYNVLSNGNQIPKFSTTRATNVVSHREYLGDITGTVAFTNRTFPINPGSAITFPWLATIAQNYQQYRIHGIIFEFRPLITDFVTSGAPGVVVMATNYNADEPAYTTKQAMENSEYAVSVKPTCNLMHGVECASNQTVLSELYVRPAGLASNLDLKFTDLGNFQFATQGNPTQLLGELWCSYTVEFFKPVLPNDVGGNVQSQSITRTSFNAANPLGGIGVYNAGDLAGFTINSTSFSWIGQPGNLYSVNLNWFGTIPAAIAYPPSSISGGAAFFGYFNKTQSFELGPANGANSTTMIANNLYICNSTTPTLMTVSFNTVLGVFPTGTAQVDILITQVSDNI